MQTCVSCKKDKKLEEFYISKSVVFSNTGRIPICKDCLYKKCLDEEEIFSFEKFEETLRQIDKPFILKVWQSALDEADTFKASEKARSKRAFSIYFKNINSLKQYRYLTFSASEDMNERFRVGKDADVEVLKHEKAIRNEKIITCEDEEFKVTPEIIELFGDGYNTLLYKKMYEKYNKIKLNYTLQTNLHQEALATYVRFKVQEEIATANGNVVEAKKWYEAAISAADSGKLMPKQLTKADLDGGVNSISEIAKAVEQAVDVIKILPRFKYRPNDAPDFNIFCYVNYERKLDGQPPATYEDIYKFYDDKKAEYIKQNGDPYGIFENDTAEKNRDTIKTFITLPEDYDDTGGDDVDG